jgi:hypothetical protein
MRTTPGIDDQMPNAAKEIARRERKTAGARRTEYACRCAPVRVSTRPD